MLSEQEINRYKRNIMLPELGIQGQEKLKKSSVFVIGAGGLGSPLLLYLVAAGVGKIRIAEFDVVDITNLQRQILYKTPDLGQSKGDIAKTTLNLLNPDVDIQVIPDRIVRDNASGMFQGSDLIIDASDNYSTKFLSNDTCTKLQIPLLLGAVSAFEGHIMGISDKGTPCYRCIFKEIPSEEHVPKPSSLGILGAAAGVTGSLQAIEAIKFLSGIGSIMGKMIRIDLLETSVRTISIPVRADCQCQRP